MENGNEAVAPALIVRSAKFKTGHMPSQWRHVRVEFMRHPCTYDAAAAHMAVTHPDGMIVSRRNELGPKGGMHDLTLHKTMPQQAHTRWHKLHIVTRIVGM